MTLARIPKSKACKICKERFHPSKPLQVVCGLECAIEDVARQRERRKADHAKAVRRSLKERKEKLKNRSAWMREAQVAFNAFVRERDRGLPCISCGGHMSDESLITGSRTDCGHYRSVGAAPHLRLDLRNAHAQCVKCNRHLSGNTVSYRLGLIARVGEARVLAVEHDNEPRQHDIAYLRRAKAIFTRRALIYRRIREMSGASAC